MSCVYKTPMEAIQGPKEKVLYTVLINSSDDKSQPDRFATIDVDPSSPTYSQVLNTLKMKYPGDELHHFNWNTCSSCTNPDLSRRFLIVPGFFSSRIYILDCLNEKSPSIYKIIEPEEIVDKFDLTAPHTVHCLPDGNVMISFLGDKNGNPPGGFLILNSEFEPVRKWGESDYKKMDFNYDFWYQPFHNVMVSSEWTGPVTFTHGFSQLSLAAGKFGQKVNFWDWKNEKILKTIDLGKDGVFPFEVRFLHNPLSSHGFVVCPQSSSIWHWWKSGNEWHMDKVVQLEPLKTPKSSLDVPMFTIDLVISMDDQWMYTSNWLCGEVHQYNISDPHNPILSGKIKLGGLGQHVYLLNNKLTGGPQMLQLSLDGKRLYVTNSLISVWDDQFYPDVKDKGSYMLKIICDSVNGGMKLDESFFVDFGTVEKGPYRAHEIRYPGGDCTSDIWRAKNIEI